MARVLITVPQVLAILGISRPTYDRLRKEGVIKPAYENPDAMSGTLRLYDRDKIEALARRRYDEEQARLAERRAHLG